jgi:hypothetical protein
MFFSVTDDVPNGPWDFLPREDYKHVVPTALDMLDVNAGQIRPFQFTAVALTGPSQEP